MKRSKYRVIEDGTTATIDAFYGNADADYVEKCQKYGIPQEDLDFMIREYGKDEIMSMLEEM